MKNNERIQLKKLLNIINEFEKVDVSMASIVKDNTCRYTIEGFINRIGEFTKDIRDGFNSLFTSDSIFRQLRKVRNKVVHEETPAHKLIELARNVFKGKSFLQKLLGENNSKDEKSVSFEMFGQIGNEEQRKEFVDAIDDKLENPNDEDLLALPEESNIKNYSEAIKAITDNETLLEQTQLSPKIAEEVRNEILDFANKTAKKIARSNPFFEEEEKLEKTKEQTTQVFGRSFPALKRELSEKYTKEEINLSFFDKKRKELFKELKNEEDYEKKPKIEKQIKALQQNFVTDWEAQLNKKQLQYELDIIDKERAKFAEELYKKIEQFKQLKSLLQPFTNDLGRLWDLSQKEWKNVGFDVLKKYAHLLEQDKTLQELAELLGRFRKAEIEYEEEIIKTTEFKQEWKIERARKSEFIGIKESDDLSTMLPTETALLADVITEDLFIKKFAEKKLLTFDYQNKRAIITEIEKEETRKKQKEKDKGPIVICVDTSGSMHGTPEYVAKVICFAITKIALRDKRKCFLISFSTGIKTLDLSNLANSLDELVKFLSHSFQGGTDAKPALDFAIEKMNTEAYKKSDLLLISDFVMPAFSDDFKQKIEISKANKNKFHSLTISKTGNKNVFDSFDYNWVYDTANPNGLLDLVKQIEDFETSRIKR